MIYFVKIQASAQAKPKFIAWNMPTRLIFIFMNKQKHARNNSSFKG